MIDRLDRGEFDRQLHEIIDCVSVGVIPKCVKKFRTRVRLFSDICVLVLSPEQRSGQETKWFFHLAGPFQPSGLDCPLSAWCGGGASGINQKTQRPVHGVGIGECFRQIGLDQHQVCSSHGPFVVLAADATFELRQDILRPKLVTAFLC